MNKIYFENLNGLRFLAFLAIFFYHTFISANSEVIDSTFYRFLEDFKRPLGLGVPFFFCLSGFLITYLLLSEIKECKKIHIGKFYVRRILRIWVLYYLVVFIGFVIYPIVIKYFLNQEYSETVNIWNYIFFLSNFDQLMHGIPYATVLGVTWSLSVEEQFYFVWPILLSVIKPKYYSILTLTLFAVGNILMIFFNLPYIHTLGSMVDLSLGSFMAIMCFNRSYFFHSLQNVSRRTILLVYAAGFIHILLWINFNIGFRFLASIFMAFVIFEQSYCQNSFCKMSDFRRMSYLGTLTYGLYLLHMICIFIVHNLLYKLEIKTGIPIVTDLIIEPLLSLGLTLVAGYFSYKYIESPVLKLKLKFSFIDSNVKGDSKKVPESSAVPVYKPAFSVKSRNIKFKIQHRLEDKITSG